MFINKTSNDKFKLQEILLIFLQLLQKINSFLSNKPTHQNESEFTIEPFQKVIHQDPPDPHIISHLEG